MKEIPPISDAIKNCLTKENFEDLKTHEDIEGLFSSVEKGNKTFIKFGKAIQDGSIKLNEGQTLLSAYNNYIGTATIKTKLFSAATKAISVVGWMAVVAIIGAVIQGISDAIVTNKEYIESQQEIADRANEQIEKYDDEIDSLTSLQEKLKDARGNKEKLASIQEELNNVIGKTPGLLNDEGGAWETANQRIIDRIALLEKERKLELDKKVNANREIYNNREVENNWGFDYTAKGYFDDFFYERTEEYDKLVNKYLSQLSSDSPKSMAEMLSDSITAIPATGIFLGAPSAEEFETYYNEQYKIAEDACSEYIDNLNTILPKESLYGVLENLVYVNSEDLDSVKDGLVDFVEMLESSGVEEAYSKYIESLTDDTADSEALYNELSSIIDSISKEYPVAAQQLNYFLKSVGTGINPSSKGTKFEEEKKELLEFSVALNKLSSEAKSKLKDFTISGEFSPEILSSTKEYRQLLEDTGLTAEQAADKIKEMYLSSGEFSEMLDSLNSFASLIKNVEDEIAQNGKLSFATLQSIAKQYPTLEKYVIDYLNGVEGAETQLINALKEGYSTDLSNYKLYLELKQGNDTAWWNNYYPTASSFVRYWAEQYNLDLQNFSTYSEAVANIEAAIEEAKNSRTTESDSKEIKNYNEKIKRLSEVLAEMKKNLNDSLVFGDWDAIFNPPDEGDKDDEGGGDSPPVSSTDQLADAFNKELNLLKHKLAMEQITEKEYYDTLDRLNKEYYAGKEDYLDQYRQYEEEVYNGLISIHNSAFSKEYSALKHQLNMNLITQAQYFSQLDKLNRRYYANNSKYLDEYQQYEEEIYNGLLSLQSEAISSIEKLIDLRINMIRDMKNDEIEAIEKVIDAEKEKLEAINKTIDARKEAMELLKEEKDHEAELSEKNKSVTDIQIQLEALKYDNSASAQKKRRQLEEELANAQKELTDYISDYEYDKALEQLDKEAELAEEEYNQTEEKLQNQIDLIQEYLDNEAQLLLDATNDINGMNETLYTNMMNWAKETTGSVWEVVDAWKAAKESLESYNGVNSVQKTLDTLKKNQINNVAASISGGASSTGGTSSSNPANNAQSSSSSNSSNGNSGYKAVHTILKNDSLWTLAQKYYSDGTKWTKIQQANGNIDPYKLQVGKKLYIPYKKGTPYIPNDQLALTDESGEELTLHANERGTLQFLTKGSSVIPSEITKNLMEWGKETPSALQKSLSVSQNIQLPSDITVNNSSPSVSVGDIVINGGKDITKDDLNRFRNDVVDAVYDSMQKNRVKSGIYGRAH